MDEDLSPRLSAALEQMRAASEMKPSPGGVASAHGAMHRALNEQRRPSTWFRTLRLAAAPAVALLALASVGASAADARPGSPLHVARQVEEEIRFDIAGDGRTRLAAEFAKKHLDDARDNGVRDEMSVNEAKQWVDRAKHSLPSGDAAADRSLVDQVSHEVDQQEGGNQDHAGSNP
jgi:hypothetical protein